MTSALLHMVTAQHADTKKIIVAHASMAGAAPLLDDLGIPVLASPELALRAALTRL